MLFYDGACGLCHRSVRLLLWADPEGQLFRFAALGGPTFQARVPAAARAALPDSFVLKTTDGRLLTRSASVLHILDRLGGGWRLLGWLCRLVPRPFRDAIYDGIARVRRRLFAKPEEACPMVAPHLRGRFLP